jgi:hypothetical protein
MGQAERPTCPKCGAYLILALPPGGKGQRTFQCFDCDGPDPLKTERAIRLSTVSYSRRSKAASVGGLPLAGCPMLERVYP